MTRLIGTVELRQAIQGDEVLLLSTELPSTASKNSNFIVSDWYLKFKQDMVIGWLCTVIGKI